MPISTHGIYNLPSLKEYILRQLGSPVINIEVDEEQIFDRIYDAFQYFVERHYAGHEEVWIPILITEEIHNQGYVSLPEGVEAVLEVIDSSDTQNLSSEEFERINFVIAQTDWIHDISRGGGITSYVMAMSHVNLLNEMFSPDRVFEYNHITRRLIPNGMYKTGSRIVVRCFRAIDPELSEDFYNNRWIKEYATALVGLQWGSNISKYDGVQIPGGLILNGQQIYDRYEQRIRELIERFQLEYEMPFGVIIS